MNSCEVITLHAERAGRKRLPLAHVHIAQLHTHTPTHTSTEMHTLTYTYTLTPVKAVHLRVSYCTAPLFHVFHCTLPLSFM